MTPRSGPMSRIRRLLTKREVSEILVCSLRGVDLLVASGKLRKRVIARRIVRFSPNDVETLIDASASEVAPDD